MSYEHCVWFFWSLAFLVPWGVLFYAFPRLRREMLWASVFTAPFGLTEPLFVPEYWNPPSLFDLAQKTGFDIESLMFCFGIGGVGAVLYNVLTGSAVRSVSSGERHSGRHRFHYPALASPFVVFFVLVWFRWNPIYPGIVALFAGVVTSVLCRPDLARKIWVGGILFLVYYFVFLAGLQLLFPDYIGRVWNLDALLGIEILGIPIEEFFFALGFGMYWSSVYEHFTWHTTVEHHTGEGTGDLPAPERKEPSCRKTQSVA